MKKNKAQKVKWCNWLLVNEHLSLRYYSRLDIDCCAIHMCWTCIRGSARWTECRYRAHRHYSARVEHRARWIVSVQVRSTGGNHCKRHHCLSRWTANRVHLHGFIHSLNGKCEKKTNWNFHSPRTQCTTKRQLWNGKWHTSWWDGHIEESHESGQ